MRKRGKTYYVKRKFGTIGMITRSLGTSSKTRARQLEDMLLWLHGKGWFDLIRSFKAGELEIDRLAEAFESSKLPTLSQSLKRKPVLLSEAIDACRIWKKTDVKASTLKRYGEGWYRFKDYAGEDATVQDVLTTEGVQGFKALCMERKAKPETTNNHLISVSVLAIRT